MKNIFFKLFAFLLLVCAIGQVNARHSRGYYDSGPYFSIGYGPSYGGWGPYYGSYYRPYYSDYYAGPYGSGYGPYRSYYGGPGSAIGGFIGGIADLAGGYWD